jgi:hypothetical protein
MLAAISPRPARFFNNPKRANAHGPRFSPSAPLSTGERTGPITGNIGRLRIVATIADPAHFTVKWLHALEDGVERRTVTMVHTRGTAALR